MDEFPEIGATVTFADDNQGKIVSFTPGADGKPMIVQVELSTGGFVNVPIADMEKRALN